MFQLPEYSFTNGQSLPNKTFYKMPQTKTICEPVHNVTCFRKNSKKCHAQVVIHVLAHHYSRGM